MSAKRFIGIALALSLAMSASGQSMVPYGPGPMPVAAGQIPAVQTNTNACTTCIGYSVSAATPNESSTVTITIAAPGVISWTAHGLGLGSSVFLTTTGALPTGLSANTQYWVIPVNANSFELATSIANAIAGTAINTTGTQSGTQTAVSAVALSSGNASDIAFLSLPPGKWAVSATYQYVVGSGTTTTVLAGWVNTTSATTPPVQTSPANFTYNLTFSASQNPGVYPTGSVVLTLSSTTTVYASCKSTFAVSTMSCFAFIQAVRVG